VPSLSQDPLAEVFHARGFVRPSLLQGSSQTGDHGGQVAVVGTNPRRSRRSDDRSTPCQLEMNAEPPAFDRAALGAALQERELSITSLTYLPLGAGSHHYLARDAVGDRWCVTVDVHVDDADTRHMWTMLQSLLGEAGEASSWGRR
jgi:hypothetical protein